MGDERPDVLDVPEPPPNACPPWCTAEHFAVSPRGAMHAIVHRAEVSPLVMVVRMDEWYSHEAERGENRWRENPLIWLLRPDADPAVPLSKSVVRTIHQPYELRPLVELGPLLLPGVLDAVLQAAEMLGWEVPS